MPHGPRGLGVALGATLALVSGSAVGRVSPSEAAPIFAEARAICDRDQGRFWGVSLCGPILLVDPTDRSVIANVADTGGVLAPSGPDYVGVLPPSVILANTPVEWSGQRWTELLLPLEPKADARTYPASWHGVLIAHEMFHRIQPGLKLTRDEAGNRHLDTFQGRYLMQLEWRALAAALNARTIADRDLAIADALLFRRERYRLFPGAAAEEAALEINEGIPEYTGVMLGISAPSERVAYAAYDLSAFATSPTFVRGFAYATGPAYGLLLDQLQPGWRGKLNSGARLDELLSDAAGASAKPAADLSKREAAYDDGSLRAAELKREDARLSHQAALRAQLIDGPVLILPLHHVAYQFNPQTLVPLGEAGTVYPTARLATDWGVLTITDGVLLSKDMTVAHVSAAGIDLAKATGPGWRLELKPGWKMQPASRTGDFTVREGPP